MKTMLLFRLLAASLAVTAALPAFSHHSTAGYDLIHGTIIYGTVERFDWENPHAHISVTVEGEDGAVEHWAVELESANVLHSLGWVKDTLKPGMQLSVTGGRAKDGGFRIRATSVQLPGGKKLQALALPEN